MPAPAHLLLALPGGLLQADMDRLSRRLNLQCDLPFCFLSVPPHNTQDMQADHWLHLLPTLERESLVRRWRRW